MFRNLSLQSKLVLILISVCLLTAIPLAYVGYTSGNQTLTNNVKNSLYSQLKIRANACTQMLETTKNIVVGLSANGECVEAMKAFSREFAALEKQSNLVSDEDRAALEKFYRETYLPGLKRLSDGEPSMATYYPKSAVTEYLQSKYIAQTPDPYEAKGKIESLGNGTEYDKLHAKYHPNLAMFANGFRFEDVMLVDLEGNVVYTCQKSVEFGSNMNNGPYAESNAGRLVRSIRRANDRDAYEFADFERYKPNLNKPYAFMASPIFDEGQMIGTLVLQVTTEPLAEILTANRQWEQQGLGKTGEVYLVGKDKLFRSGSRIMMTDPEAALKSFQQAGVPENVVETIRRQGTVTLALSADTVATDSALAGKCGVKIYPDYRHELVIGAYCPFEFAGTRWAMLSEMDEAEAFEPTRTFCQQILIATAGACFGVTLLGLLFAQLFVSPLKALTSAALRVAQGELGAQAAVDTWDEFRDLANAFNEMSKGLKEKTDELRSQIGQNEELLLNILPAPAAARLKDGDTHSMQAFSDVTVLYAQVVGLQELVDSLGTEKAMSHFRDLVVAFDDAAERHGAEKVTTSGVSYLAVCGLSVPRPDHTARLCDFAGELVKIVERFNRERGSSLQLLVGINSGPVTGGVVGRNKFIYDLWGDTVTVARALGGGNETGIRLTRSVYERVHDQYSLGDCETQDVSGKGPIEYWTLQLS